MSYSKFQKLFAINLHSIQFIALSTCVFLILGNVSFLCFNTETRIWLEDARYYVYSPICYRKTLNFLVFQDLAIFRSKKDLWSSQLGHRVVRLLYQLLALQVLLASGI